MSRQGHAPEVEQAHSRLRAAVRPMMTVSPGCTASSECEDDPLLHVRVHNLRVVDDGAEHDQPA